MEFDLDKFGGQHFDAREKDVPVPDLKPFFKGKPEKDPETGKDKPPVCRVRMLTSADLARAREAQQKNRDRNAIAASLFSGNAEQMTEALRELLGTSETVPDDTAWRIEILVLGGVKPEWPQSQAVKLANTYPVVFKHLTDQILTLTGLGAEPGKPKRSSGNKTSGTRSASAT